MGNQEHADLPFTPPRSYSPGRPSGPPRLIVVHYTAGSEGPSSAEDGAAEDQRRTDGTSAHYYVDQDSVVQCVYTWDRAHTALWNGNQAGIHYELCGTRQTAEQWADAASTATIRSAAEIMRRDMVRYGIPAVRLTPTQVRAGAKGLCGHADVTAAFPEDGGTHADPGPEFPWDTLLGLLGADGATTTRRGPAMVIATDGKTFVLTDWDTWHDRSLSYEQVAAFREGGVPQVPVTAGALTEILSLPAPRRQRSQAGVDPAVLADELALALISRIADRGA